jgi:hypothetical protein
LQFGGDKRGVDAPTLGKQVKKQMNLPGFFGAPPLPIGRAARYKL